MVAERELVHLSMPDYVLPVSDRGNCIGSPGINVNSALRSPVSFDTSVCVFYLVNKTNRIGRFYNSLIETLVLTVIMLNGVSCVNIRPLSIH